MGVRGHLLMECTPQEMYLIVKELTDKLETLRQSPLIKRNNNSTKYTFWRL